MENKRHYKDVLLKKIDLVTFFGFTNLLCIHGNVIMGLKKNKKIYLV